MEECLANPDDSFVMGIIEPLRSVTWQFSDESGTKYLLLGICTKFCLMFWKIGKMSNKKGNILVGLVKDPKKYKTSLFGAFRIAL